MKIKSYKINRNFPQNGRPLWPIMLDDKTPTHERSKLVKTYNNVLPWDLTVTIMKLWIDKVKNVTGHMWRNWFTKKKGNTERKRGKLTNMSIYMFAQLSFRFFSTVSSYWHTDTVNCTRHSRVKHRRVRLVFGWCLTVLRMRLWTETLGASLEATVVYEFSLWD